MSQSPRSPTNARRSQTYKLPDLSKPPPPPMNKAAVLDEINALRLQASQLESERRQTKSKTSRLLQVVNDRNSQIKKALKGSDEKQASIKTASDSTLYQLRQNIASLEHTLESRESELEVLKTNDELANSDELQVEVIEYFCEFERLQKQVGIVHEGEKVVNGEVERLKQTVIDSQGYDKYISDLQREINALAEKLVAYRQGEQRMETNSMLAKVQANPETARQERRVISEDIEDLNAQKEAIEDEIRVILENDTKNREYLQEVMEQQAALVEQAMAEEGKKGKALKTAK